MLRSPLQEERAMLRAADDFKGLSIAVADGDIGSVSVT
jgi:hypothetical protein